MFLATRSRWHTHVGSHIGSRCLIGSQVRSLCACSEKPGELRTHTAPKPAVLSPEDTIVPGWLPSYLRPERAIASPGFNRWLALPPVVAVQLSIGSLYAWSIFNGPLTRDLGVITA